MYLVPPSRLVQQEILLTVFPSFRGFLEVWVLVFGFLLLFFFSLPSLSFLSYPVSNLCQFFNFHSMTNEFFIILNNHEILIVFC